MDSIDSYSELLYDPNWRTNLRRNGSFMENPEIYIEEYQPEQECIQSCGDRQGMEINGGYRYIIDTAPAVVELPHMAVNEPDQPYYLHLQDTQISSAASLSCHKNDLQCRSPHTELSRTSSFSPVNEIIRLHQPCPGQSWVEVDDLLWQPLMGAAKRLSSNLSDNASQRRLREFKNAESFSTAPRLTQELHALESQSCYQQELGHTQQSPSKTQKKSKSTSRSSKVLWNNKLETVTNDIVERNKITLGRNTSKYGSYVRAHAFKLEMPHKANKETVSTENQEDSSRPEMRLLRKTQQLQVTQISKGKKALLKEYIHPSQEEYIHPSQQQQPPSLVYRTGRGDRLSSQLAKPVATHGGQNSAALLGHPHWSHASKVHLVLTPGIKQTDSEKPSCMSPHGLNEQLHQQNPKSTTDCCQWKGMLNLPMSCDGEDQILSPNEAHINQVPQNFLKTPTAALSQALGSYTVLPPIRKSPTGKDHELSPGQPVNTAHPSHRSGSGSYLCQMEKQKQLRDRDTDKKQQKLYSNAICGQNNKISRISFLPAKDQEGNEKNVPRTKALEYAKTIPKPPLQSQPKQKQPPESFTEHEPYLQGLDASQLSTLKLLRKRHEEEKQAVAQFRKVHDV